HTAERWRERRGYRGHWRDDHGKVQVELKMDDTVCTPISEYSGGVPNHPREWHLECKAVRPRNHPILTVPALLCRLVGPHVSPREEAAYVVPQVLDGSWMVLGSGDGLRIWVDRQGVGPTSTAKVKLQPAAPPIDADAWEHSF